jgi:hypothetical protein
MRIRELLENRHFKDLDFVNSTENGREINFDLIQDLIEFMNTNDNVYRRHVYPSIARCIDISEQNRSFKSSVFKPAVEKSYEAYLQQFPIRELPQSLDEETCVKICKKMKEEVSKHIADGKYKD